MSERRHEELMKDWPYPRSPKVLDAGPGSDADAHDAQYDRDQDAMWEQADLEDYRKRQRSLG